MDVPPAYEESAVGGQGEAPDSGQVTPVASGELLELWPPASLLADLPLKTLETVEESWLLPSFSPLTGKVIGPVFSCGGASWRLLLFPQGNQGQGSVSLFLENVEAAEATAENDKWAVCAQFVVAMVNPTDDRVYKISTASHRFSPTCTDWGFAQFVKTASLGTPVDALPKPLMEEDTLKIVTVVKVVEDETGYLWHSFENWDSKKETGYVGLKNQGATCYMNSLLQSLYFTNYFRKATFQIPTDTDVPQKSVALAMQRAFYNLQHSDGPVGTTELTKSFGWDTLDSFMQHDVQEFNRVLQDNLESKMKGTLAEGAISNLFKGKMKSYIKCINVDFESSRVEDYYDIQLNVKGCKTLSDSFRNYCAVETLDGDNKYQAEGYGLQDAKKGVMFKSFPPVLHLQLKRFEYDMERDAMVKINDRHEYPPDLDLEEFLESNGEVMRRQRYHLHGVLVHMGDVHGGHYMAFIKPERGEKWFKFDDDKVTPAIKHEVFDQNFGGDSQNVKTGNRIRRMTNAYMLVYILEDRLDEILSPVTEADIPVHLIKAIDQERIDLEERTKAFKDEQSHIYIKILDDAKIASHDGYDLCNPENKAYPLTEFDVIKVHKDSTLLDFKTTISKRAGVLCSRVRLWSICTRQNRTVRLDVPINEPDEISRTVESLFAKHGSRGPDTIFYVDILDQELVKSHQKPSMFQGRVEDSGNESILLFIKVFEQGSGLISYGGKFQVKNKMKPMTDLVKRVREKFKIPLNVRLRFLEEIKPGMVERIDVEHSYHTAELMDGDIIIVERDLSEEESKQFRHPSVVSYFEAYQNRVLITFKPTVPIANQSKDLVLPLSRKSTYHQVLAALAVQIQVAADHILLCQPGPGSQRTPIKFSATMTVHEMLGVQYYPNAMNILYFEVLSMTLQEFESKQFVRISYLDGALKEQGPLDLFVFKTASLGQVLEEVFGQIKRDVHGSGRARFYEVVNSRIYRWPSLDDPVHSIPSSSQLYVEDIPEEELSMGSGDRLVNVIHYTRDVLRGHGVPFQFVLKGGEMFAETKKRLQNRIGMSDKDFAKVKFSVILLREIDPRGVEEDDILADFEWGSGDLLGLDHLDKSSRSHRSGGMEKAIKIFN